jgi:hypothetical protein
MTGCTTNSTQFLPLETCRVPCTCERVVGWFDGYGRKIGSEMIRWMDTLIANGHNCGLSSASCINNNESQITLLPERIPLNPYHVMSGLFHRTEIYHYSQWCSRVLFQLNRGEIGWDKKVPCFTYQQTLSVTVLCATVFPLQKMFV